VTRAKPPTWSRVKAILGEALELEGAAREAFVERACAGQPALRERVGALLRAHGASGRLQDGDSPARAVAPFEPGAGAMVGRYRIVRLIARGGMGAVYEAVDEQLGRPVAVKLMQGLASGSMLKRFELESRLLARLRHPGIAQIFEAGTVAGPGRRDPTPFFAMELIGDATPITDFAEREGLSTEDRVRLFIGVCEAVTHGHQRSVIHRDLKPGNILVDAAGRPKIIDFGVARATDQGAAATTLAGELLGTLRYMSPEQLGGVDPEDLDVRTDVYALGVVLYELLAGRPPHPDPPAGAGGVVESIRGAADRTPAPLSRLAPHLKGDIETVALKAVRADRGARYQSVAELAADLLRVLRHEPISARPLSAAYQVRMFARRHRALVAGAAGVFAALALGVVGTSVGLVHAWRAEAAAKAQTRRAERVAAFLENTIRAADPKMLPPATIAALDPRLQPMDAWISPAAGWGSAGPAEVGVAGVLRHAAAHLRADFGDDPALLAEVSILLALTLSSLEDNKTAVVLLEQALTEQSGLLPPDDEAIIRTRVLYAGMLASVGRGEESVSQVQSALASARRTFGAMDPRTLAVGDMLVDSLARAAGRYEDAMAMARRSIEEVGGALGADTAAAWQRHAVLIGLMDLQPPKDRGVMIAECRATIDGLARSVGPDFAPIAQVSSWLAAQLAGDPATIAEAEALVRRALAIDTAFRGPDSPAVYDRRTALAGILLKRRKLGEAEAVTRGALESALRMIGARSPYTIKAEARLARVLTWQEKDPEEAERLARHAAEESALIYGPAEAFASYHDAIWAAAVRQRGHPEQAERMLRERIALRGTREPRWDDAWVEAYQYLQLALCLRDEGRRDEAGAAIRTARAWGEQLGDPLHSVLLNIIDVEAELEGSGKRPG
jgi:eukaryotic-like serine/threonine-protein kinase